MRGRPLAVGSGRAADLGVCPETHREQREAHGRAASRPAWQPAQKEGCSVGPPRPRVEGSGSPGVVGWKKSSKKALGFPPGWLHGAQREQQTRKAISPVRGEPELLQQGAERLRVPPAPSESEDPGSHRIKPFGSNRFDFFFTFFFFFPRAAMTCHVKAFY